MRHGADIAKRWLQNTRKPRKNWRRRSPKSSWRKWTPPRSSPSLKSTEFAAIRPSSSSTTERPSNTTVGLPEKKSYSYVYNNCLNFVGGRTSEGIISWLNKKTGPPAKELKTVEEAQAFIDDNKVAVVGFFKDQKTEKAAAFLATAFAIDDQAFGVTSSEEVFKHYEAECGSIVLFKKFDEGKDVFEGEATEDNIRKFVQSNSLPLIVEFNHETAQKIFGGDIKSHLLLFLSKSDEHFEKVSEAARSIAKPYRSRVLFVTIDANEEDHQRILEFFGMKKDEVPAARLIKLEEDMAKYKPDSAELTAENLKAFVDAFLDGSLKQHLLSQDVPEDWNKTPVKTLVASNFDSVVFDTSKNVLVEFYAPWCGHCKQLVPIYEKVGEHFDKSDDVVVAKMDATANELEHTKITNFPTLKLYTKESNKVIEYNGPRTFEGLVKFLETGGEDGAGPEEELEEAEDDDQPRKDEL